jgi:4-amino-4-deoxy-L-arabinose transferase-like glycosyltransferase
VLTHPGLTAVRGLRLGRGVATLQAVWASDWALVVVPVALAVLARAPNLWSIPSLTDEANEVVRGLEIAQGRALPATNVATYLGALFNYLLAGLFLVFGPSAYLPRLVVMVTGVLTVVATYVLARELATSALATSDPSARGHTRLVGLIAAALLAANGGHTLVNSHVAWSHSTTPLFATFGLLLFHRAVARGDLRVLFGAVFLLAVMLQSHSTEIALLPGLALYAVLMRPAWIRDLRVWLVSPLILIAVNANLLIYNLATAGDSLNRARIASEAYARGAAGGWELYLESLGKLGLALLRLTAGAIDVRSAPAAYLADPLVWLSAGLVLVGTALCLRRGDPFVPCVALPFALLFAYVNSKYQIVPNARFLMPLLPLGFAMIGIALVAPLTASSGRVRIGSAVLIVVASLALLGGALWSLRLRTEQLAPSAIATRSVADVVAAIEANREGDEPVALDPDLDKLWLDGGGDYLRALRFHLALRGIPAVELETRPRKDRGAVDSCDRNEVELRRVRPRRTPEATRIRADDTRTPADESLQSYVLIRTVQPRDDDRDEDRGQAGEWNASVAVYWPPLGASARAVDRCAPGSLI